MYMVVMNAVGSPLICCAVTPISMRKITYFFLYLQFPSHSFYLTTRFTLFYCAFSLFLRSRFAVNTSYAIAIGRGAEKPLHRCRLKIADAAWI